MAERAELERVGAGCAGERAPEGAPPTGPFAPGATSTDGAKLDVDAIHSQLHLMNVERLAKRYRGRVTFWGEVDCQDLQNLERVKEFLETSLAVRKALDFGHGGVIAQCPWNHGVRLQTIAAFFEQWLVPLPMHG